MTVILHDAMQEKVLELELRSNLYSLIRKSPGLHFRELQRRTNMATGQLTHHLDYLQKVSLINTRSDGEYLRYYADMQISDKERKVLELVRRKSVRHILLYLLEYQCCNHGQLVQSSNLSAATISWHLKKLVDSDTVDKKVVGRNSFYSINDVQLVKNTLIKYRGSFLDQLVDKFIEMWETSLRQ